MIELEAAARDLIDPIIDACEHAGHGDAINNIVIGYTSESPSGGIHWLTYTPGDPIGNLKLARRPATPTELANNPDNKTVTLIETRGDGGYTIEPPTPGYTQLAGGYTTIATTPRHALQAILDILATFGQQPPTPNPTTPHKPTQAPSQAADGPAPWETFNRTCNEILEAAGFTFHHQDTKGTHYTRPGKNTRDGASATVWHDNHRCTLWSTSIDAPPEALDDRRNLSAWQLHTFLNHKGDFAQAARTQRHHMPPTAPRADPETGETEPAADTCRLPDDFWTARPHLNHLRQAAWARGRSAEAVLHAALTRIAAFTSLTVEIPPIVGGAVGLTYFATLVAPVGRGKSSAAKIAAEQLPTPPGDKIADLPAGSGEGLAEALFDWVTEPDPDTGKNRKVKRQTRHNAIVYIDEGEVLAQMASRRGNTGIETLRSIWTGEKIGQANASDDRKRIIPAGQYVFGVAIGIQDAKAGPLFDDAAGGLTQRLAWAPANAGNAPPPGERPNDPPPLKWQPPAGGDLETPAGGGYRRRPLTIHPDIRSEVEWADHQAQQDGTEGDPLDAHGMLLRLKIAALLAVLDGRLDINLDDWHLAAQIKTASDATRTRVWAVVQHERRQAEQAERNRHVHKAVAADQAVETRRTVECARRIAHKVHDDPNRWSRSELRRSMRRWRDIYDDALDHATAEGWVRITEEPTPTGATTQTLKPGDTKP